MISIDPAKQVTVITDTPEEDVTRLLAGGDVAFVDVYEGKGVSEDQRSITVRLEYRSDERTLIEDEVEDAFVGGHDAGLDDGEPLFAAERAKVRKPLEWLIRAQGRVSSRYFANKVTIR